VRVQRLRRSGLTTAREGTLSRWISVSNMMPWWSHLFSLVNDCFNIADARFVWHLVVEVGHVHLLVLPDIFDPGCLDLSQYPIIFVLFGGRQDSYRSSVDTLVYTRLSAQW
jgi:hypothetical protein